MDDEGEETGDLAVVGKDLATFNSMRVIYNTCCLGSDERRLLWLIGVMPDATLAPDDDVACCLRTT